MASSPDFVDYLCEMLEGMGSVRSKKMFGEYMVYLNDRPVLLVCDDTVFVKMLPNLEGLLGDRPTASPYGGAKPHYVLDPDDRDTLRRAVALAEEVTPVPKKKAPKQAAKGEPTQTTGPIPWAVAWPKHLQPTLQDIAQWVESPLWGELLLWLEENYDAQPSVEYSRCGMDPGWNVKFKKGSKALCALYVRKGFFTCLVSFGARDIPQLELLLPTFTTGLQEIYDKTSFFQGGKWMIQDVNTREQLEDMQRLMLLKAKPIKKNQ